MDWRELQPETPEERLIYWTIVSTWGLWLLGSLYVVGPVLGYTLLAIILARALGLLESPIEVSRMPVGVVLWCVGMLAMLLALVVAHLDFELGLLQLVKSSIGWAKGWALLAVFVLAGALLKIRAAVVYRATGILAAQSLMLAPVFFLASIVGLPSDLYVSPLRFVGGPGPEFFDVTLYAMSDTSGAVRWRFYSPWSTAAAFIAGIGFVFALYERWRAWQVVGVVSAIVVCFMAGSRTSVIALPAIVVLVLMISNVRRPAIFIALAAVAAVAILFVDQIVAGVQDFEETLRSARAASSRVRAALGRIAYHRWETEAPVFGHGIVERGPHLVQYMAIGSHHTWHGLLFVKGAVGFLALAIPLAWSIAELALKAQVDRVARAGLGVLLALVLFSFSDNLEIVSYLIWPGMVIVGIAHARRLRNPFAGFLGTGGARHAFA
jgi:hypothetical protein